MKQLKKKILLVDDSKTALLMEKMILGKAGHELVMAADGEEALQKASEECPDLILLDIMMPNMDGIEVCRRLRAQEATRSTPIIMVTTRGEEEFVEEAFGSGCTDFVTKPINGLELATKVRTYLECDQERRPG